MPFDSRGWEIPDQTPVARPVGWTAPESLTEQIRRLVRGELSRQAVEAGHESFEEADDFEVGDDFDPQSPWELTADQEGAPARPPEAPTRPASAPVATTPAAPPVAPAPGAQGELPV